MSFANTPTLKIGSQTLGSSTQLGDIKLENNSWKTNNTTHTLTWELSGDIYTPKGTSGFNGVNVSNNPIDSLMLEFINNGSTTMVVNNIATQPNKGIFAAIRPQSTEASLELDFGDKGLRVEKQLNVTFNNGTGKSVTVKDLGALEGNVSIYDTTGGNTFTLTAKSIKGHIELSGGKSDGTAGVATSDSKITINGGSLEGNINTVSDVNMKKANIIDNKGLSVTFENGASMQGNLGVYAGYDTIKKTLIFKGGDNKTVMSGNIISYGTAGDKDFDGSNMLNNKVGNHVTFEAGNMEGNIIAAAMNLNQTNWISRGYNNITFGNDTSPSTHTLTGGILAELASHGQSGDYGSQATNTITIKKDSTLHIKGTGQKTVNNSGFTYTYKNGSAQNYTIDQGSITAIDAGKNEITLQEGATLTLDGALIAKNNATKKLNPTGNLNFDRGASFKGAIKGENLGFININMKTTDNTITGNIDLNNATLNLKLGSEVNNSTPESGFTHTINGNIEAKNASVVNLDIGKAGAKPGSININGMYNTGDASTSMEFFSSATLKANGGSTIVTDGKVYVGADAVIDGINIDSSEVDRKYSKFVIGQGAGSGNSQGATGNSSLTITGNAKDLQVAMQKIYK